MKRFLCLMLTFLLLSTLPACRQDTVSYQQPVTFYYRLTDPDTTQGIIGKATVEGIDFGDDTEALLNRYFEGPSDEALVSTFPTGTRVDSVTVIGGLADIRLTSAFSTLTGIQLSVACACLTMTVIELTGVYSVRISAANAQLDGSDYITMDASCLTLFDSIEN